MRTSLGGSSASARECGSVRKPGFRTTRIAGPSSTPGSWKRPRSSVVALVGIGPSPACWIRASATGWPWRSVTWPEIVRTKRMVTGGRSFPCSATKTKRDQTESLPGAMASAKNSLETGTLLGARKRPWESVRTAARPSSDRIGSRSIARWSLPRPSRRCTTVASEIGLPAMSSTLPYSVEEAPG